MPPRYCSTWAGFAARIASTIGSSGCRVRDRLLREVGRGREAGVADHRDRLVERLPGDPVAGGDELRELGGVDGGRIDTGADELVRDHVARRDGLGALRDGRLPERVEPAGDEDERALVVERRADPADPLCG